MGHWENMQTATRIRIVDRLRFWYSTMILVGIGFVYLVTQPITLFGDLPEHDPVLAALVNSHTGLVFVGETTFSERDGVGKHALKQLPIVPRAEAGRAYILATPRNIKRMAGHAIVLSLNEKNISARLAAPLVSATVGGPYYTIDFSFDGRMGRIFNTPNQSIATDSALAENWHAEDVVVVYDK